MGISGRASRWGRGALLFLEFRARRGWLRVAKARPNRAGAFVVAWRAPNTLGAITLRLVVDRRSRLGAALSAGAHSPVADRDPDQGCRFSAAARAGRMDQVQACGQSVGAHGERFVELRADPVRPAPIRRQYFGGKFVSIGYNKDTAPHGFLGQINFVQCGATDGLYATPVTLNQAYPGAPLDLGVGFTDVTGASASATAQKSFDTSTGGIPCSGGVSGSLSGSVTLGFTPTFKASFSGLNLRSGEFEVQGRLRPPSESMRKRARVARRTTCRFFRQARSRRSRA